MTEQELQQLFKSKLRHREFPVNPDNWQAMEAMLNQRTRRRAYFKRVSTGIMAFGVLAALLALWQPAFQNGGEQGAPVAGEASVASPFGKNSSVNNLHGPHPGEAYPYSSVLHLPGAQPSKFIPKNNLTDRAQNTPGNSAMDGASRPNSEVATSNSLAYNGEGKQAAAENNLPAKQVLEKRRKAISEVEIPGKSWSLNIGANHRLKNLSETPIVLPALPAKNTYVPSPWRLMAGLTLGANNGASSRNGGNAQVDLQISYALSPAWEVYTGVGLAHYSNLDIKTRHDSVFFGFGREDVRVKTTYQKLNVLGIPLGMRYNWGKNQVQIGGYYQKVLGVQKIVRREVFSFKGRDFIEKQSTFSKVEQINTNQYGINAGYYRNIGHRWQVGVQAGFNFTDLTNNEFEQLQETFRLKRLGLSLRYNITP